MKNQTTVSGRWEQFSCAHPGAAKLLYQLFYFWVFSMGVTVFQYLVFTFMPGMLGMSGSLVMNITGICWDMRSPEMLRAAL